MSKTIKLDLGCGQNKQKGFKGVDIAPGKGVDIVHDLEIYPWPFKNNSVSEVFASHYVEHVGDWCKFMNEVYRVCRDESKVTFIHPYLKTTRAFQDPTHKQFIPLERYLYADKNWRKDNKLDHYPLDCHFPFDKVSTQHTGFNPPWNNKSEEVRQAALTQYWDVIQDLIVILTVDKS